MWSLSHHLLVVFKQPSSTAGKSRTLTSRSRLLASVEHKIEACMYLADRVGATLLSAELELSPENGRNSYGWKIKSG